MNFKKIFNLITVLIMAVFVLSSCSKENQKTDSVKIQDFEVEYVFMSQNFKGYSIYDFDYVLYDSEKEGNSKDNIVGGRYSLHRKGNSKYFENAIIITSDKRLKPMNRYTVTMNIKLGHHLHNDGAVKIYSSDSATYPWAASGDYISVIPIKDLTEGKWQKVTFTFEPSKAYIGIQTPGFVELFVDDVEFKLETSERVPLSVSPDFTEYEVFERDEEGNIIAENGIYVDVSEIKDPKLKDDNGITATVTAILIIALATAISVLLIKRKTKVLEGKDEK